MKGWEPCKQELKNAKIREKINKKESSKFHKRKSIQAKCSKYLEGIKWNYRINNLRELILKGSVYDVVRILFLSGERQLNTFCYYKLSNFTKNKIYLR